MTDDAHGEISRPWRRGASTESWFWTSTTSPWRTRFASQKQRGDGWFRKKGATTREESSSEWEVVNVTVGIPPNSVTHDRVEI